MGVNTEYRNLKYKLCTKTRKRPWGDHLSVSLTNKTIGCICFLATSSRRVGWSSQYHQSQETVLHLHFPSQNSSPVKSTSLTLTKQKCTVREVDGGVDLSGRHTRGRPDFTQPLFWKYTRLNLPWWILPWTFFSSPLALPLGLTTWSSLHLCLGCSCTWGRLHMPPSQCDRAFKVFQDLIAPQSLWPLRLCF